MISSLERNRHTNLINEKSLIHHFNKWLKRKDKTKKFIEDYLIYFKFSEDAFTHSISELAMCNVMEEPSFPLPLGFEIVPYNKGLVNIYDDEGLEIKKGVSNMFMHRVEILYSVFPSPNFLMISMALLAMMFQEKNLGSIKN